MFECVSSMLSTFTRSSQSRQGLASRHDTVVLCQRPRKSCVYMCMPQGSTPGGHAHSGLMLLIQNVPLHSRWLLRWRLGNLLSFAHQHVPSIKRVCFVQPVLSLLTMQACLLAAMKFHCYVRALPFRARADSGLALLVIQRGIDYLCNLIKTRVQAACNRYVEADDAGLSLVLSCPE